MSRILQEIEDDSQERIYALALFIADIHLGDSDCIGNAARELVHKLEDLDLPDLSDEFDC